MYSHCFFFPSNPAFSFSFFNTSKNHYQLSYDLYPNSHIVCESAKNCYDTPKINIIKETITKG